MRTNIDTGKNCSKIAASPKPGKSVGVASWRDRFERMSFIEAEARGAIQRVQNLFDEGMDLVDAASHGDMQRVKKLLDEGAEKVGFVGTGPVKTFNQATWRTNLTKQPTNQPSNLYQPTNTHTHTHTHTIFFMCFSGERGGDGGGERSVSQVVALLPGTDNETSHNFVQISMK